MTSRSPSRSSLPSKASVKTKPVLPSRASNLQRPGLGRHKTSLTPEAIKALAVKLGATDPAEELDPSASAGRLLQVSVMSADLLKLFLLFYLIYF